MTRYSNSTPPAGDSPKRSRPGRRWRVVRQRGEGGYSVVEAAVIFPLLLFLLMTIFQVALWWHARHVAQAAAQEGSRAARAYHASAAAGQERAEDYLHALGSRLLPGAQVTVTRTATTVTVHVHGTVVGIVPGLRLAVDETSSSPVERYVPPPAGFANSGVPSGGTPGGGGGQ
jgi:Flp pilus assembly protein TadG